MRVSFQGERGAYSERAIEVYFEDPSAFDVVPMPTFEDAFESLQNGKADMALIPIENSRFGSVRPVLDLLKVSDIQVVGEIILNISHNLMVLPGVNLADIRRIYSHPQALGQCRGYLRDQFPTLDIIPHQDTAGAARMIRNNDDRTSAAIASVVAANHYNMKVLDTAIQDDDLNSTRFVALKLNSNNVSYPIGSKVKTSFIFGFNADIDHVLAKALTCFAGGNIKIIKFDSRPVPRSPWTSVYYLDIEGSLADTNVKTAFDKLSELTTTIKILGSYRAGETKS